MMTIPSKEILLGILTVAVGILDAYLWQTAIMAGGFSDFARYALPVASLLAFSVLFAVAAVLIRSRWLRAGTAVLATAGGYGFVLAWPFALPAAAITALAGGYAASGMAGEAMSAASLSSRKIMRGGLSLFFTSAAILFTAFFLASPAGSSDRALEILFPDSLFELLLPALGVPLAGSPPSQTGAVSSASGARDLAGVSLLNILPTGDKNLLEQTQKILSGGAGLDPSSGEPGTDFLRRAVRAQVEHMLEPWRAYLPYAAAATFLIAVKTMTIPLYWLVLPIFALTLRLLVAVGLARQSTETIEVTKVIL